MKQIDRLNERIRHLEEQIESLLIELEKLKTERDNLYQTDYAKVDKPNRTTP